MRTSFYILLGTISLCCALPSLTFPPRNSSDSNDITEGRKFEVGQPENRQAAILAALGAGLAPILVSFFRPLISQLATTVSGAVLGKLQEAQQVIDAEPLNYDAYMVNTPNSPGPYLFLTNPNNINNENNQNTKRPLEQHPAFSIASSSPIKKHIGRINVKPQSADNDEANENENLSELRIVNSPTYGTSSDEIIARRRSKELN